MVSMDCTILIVLLNHYRHVLLLLTACITLAPLHNGLTTTLSRFIQLQTDVQRVGVHHASDSKMRDA